MGQSQTPDRPRKGKNDRISDMGKDLFNQELKQLLEFINQTPEITSQFYLTGGTALSLFYFKHRFSEDLDFFSETEYDFKTLLSAISSLGKKFRCSKIEQQKLNKQDVFYFEKGVIIKVDFAYFPFPHLGNFLISNNLKISSLEDIAVNKLQAIINRNRARDYLDLYLCLQKLNWKITDLRKNYQLKFDFYLDPQQLATSFINVSDAQDKPLFLGKTDFEDIKKYFLFLAKELKVEILK